MKKMALFLVIIIIMTSVIFGGTVSFAANYNMNYEIYTAKNITATSALISGRIIQGDITNDDITLPGYAFVLTIYETGNLSSRQDISLPFGTGIIEFSKQVANLKANTEYSYYVSGGVNITPVSGTPRELSFKTLAYTQGNFMYGDVNRDNKINSTDFSYLKRFILGMVNDFSTEKMKAADVSADGKVNSSDLVLIKRYILGLITIFPAEEALEEGWVPYQLNENQVSFSVKKDEAGNYIARVLLTFPSSGYRVTYNNEVLEGLPVAGDPDGATVIFKGGYAQVEAYKGPALTVITTKELTYNLGKVNPGTYRFLFASNGFSKDFLFNVEEEERWIPYQLNKDQLVYSLEQNSEGNYIVNVKMTFPSGGFRVDYTDEVSKEYYVLPEDGASIGFSGNANVETWTGNAPAVMVTEELKYTIGKLAPGKYKFILKADQFVDSFVFEVSERQSDIWEWYIPSTDDVSFFVQKEDNGKCFVVFAVNLPTDDYYRVEYSDELAVAAGVFPDGSTLMSYIPVLNPVFYRYDGEAEAIKTLYLKYTLSCPGNQTFKFLGIPYSFEVK